MINLLCLIALHFYMNSAIFCCQMFSSRVSCWETDSLVLAMSQFETKEKGNLFPIIDWDGFGPGPLCCSAFTLTYMSLEQQDTEKLLGKLKITAHMSSWGKLTRTRYKMNKNAAAIYKLLGSIMRKVNCEKLQKSYNLQVASSLGLHWIKTN